MGQVVGSSNYRVTNSQRRNFTAKVFDFPLFFKLRRVHTYDGQTLVVITIVPAFYERKRVAAVIAAEGPELDQHHATAQIF